MWEVWPQWTGKHDRERGRNYRSLSKNKQKTGWVVWTQQVGKLDGERGRICRSLSTNKKQGERCEHSKWVNLTERGVESVAACQQTKNKKTGWEVWTQQVGKLDRERGRICRSLSKKKTQKTQQQCDRCEHSKWVNRKRKATTQQQTKMYNPKFSGESGPYPRQEKRGLSRVPEGAPHQDDILLKWRLQRKLEAAREGRYIAPDPATSGAPITRAEVHLFLS